MYEASVRYNNQIAEYISKITNIENLNGDCYSELDDGIVSWRFKNGEIQYFSCNTPTYKHNIINPTGNLEKILKKLSK